MTWVLRTIQTLRLSVLALIFISQSALSAEDLSREYNIKAAFIYNFTKFIDWPTQNLDSESFDLCLLGDERLDSATLTIENKLVDGKPLRILSIDEVEQNSSCKIIFFAITDAELLQEAITSAESIGVLTVGDQSNFIDYGGIIALIIENNQVKFEINFEVAEQKGIKINSHLLELASRVILGPR